MPIQQTTPKITRLQYSNKDRYILNELFKRTPYPNGKIFFATSTRINLDILF